MANPAVDKLKALGLRHGEKAAVAALGVLSLLLVAKAATKETIPTTPEELKNVANQARSNLDREQKEPDILAKLEAESIKEVGFEKLVDARISTQKDATQFAYDNSWVSPEPGAGLLREDPVLIAVNDLYAHSGRGGMLVFKRDEDGELVYEEPKAEPTTPKKKKRRRPAMGSMGGMSQPGGAAKKKTGALEKQEEIARAKKAAADREKSLSGPLAKEPEKKDEEEEETLPPVEVIQGYRWAVLTAVLDHEQLRKNYAKALKIDLAAAYPHYLRVDAERQTMAPDGTWPKDWEKVDRDKNQEVLLYSTHRDEELVPDDVTLKNLVDPLPFLQVGSYRGVHVGALVPKDKRTIAAPPPSSGGPGRGGMSMPGGGRGGTSLGGEDMASRGGMSMPGNGSGPRGGMSMPGGGRGGMSMPGGPGGGGMSMSGGPGGGGMGGPADPDLEKSDAPKLMVRVLDYTVEPDETYRYRVRIVVRNPNLGVEMIVPGADNKSEEREGPWSDPSDPVDIPPDVATYAMDQGLLNPNEPRELVRFQVVRFDPVEGLTVVHNFDKGVGDVIGEETAKRVPKPDHQGEMSRRIDFNSRQVVVDTEGGSKRLNAFGIPGSPLLDPYRALVTLADGSMAIRDQARDVDDGTMKEMKDIYDEILAELKAGGKKKKKRNMSSGMSMPGAGGMR